MVMGAYTGAGGISPGIQVRHSAAVSGCIPVLSYASCTACRSVARDDVRRCQHRLMHTRHQGPTGQPGLGPPTSMPTSVPAPSSTAGPAMSSSYPGGASAYPGLPPVQPLLYGGPAAPAQTAYHVQQSPVYGNPGHGSDEVYRQQEMTIKRLQVCI